MFIFSRCKQSIGESSSPNTQDLNDEQRDDESEDEDNPSASDVYTNITSYVSTNTTNIPSDVSMNIPKDNVRNDEPLVSQQGEVLASCSNDVMFTSTQSLYQIKNQVEQWMPIQARYQMKSCIEQWVPTQAQISNPPNMKAVMRNHQPGCSNEGDHIFVVIYFMGEQHELELWLDVDGDEDKEDLGQGESLALWQKYVMQLPQHHHDGDKGRGVNIKLCGSSPQLPNHRKTTWSNHLKFHSKKIQVYKFSFHQLRDQKISFSSS